MKVELAKSAGFCFGVEKAVNTVYEEAKKNDEIVYTLGPIIHNEEVVKDMKRRGVEAVNIEDLNSLPKGTVIIRSHLQYSPPLHRAFSYPLPLLHCE